MIEDVRELLRDTLQLEDRAAELQPETPLLGGIPEFDSMAVVTVLTQIEERYDVEIDDDEVSAENFETVGSLVEFLERKLNA